ncbi:DUF3891 family protein [Conexibacter sp. JD483]|uniref:DUF3891 family protein n=1 Tax=unclassified Conexibacter TaxID=2627773 RepID=UPI0027187DC6|nr:MULTISPECIES: DUF3891 family protein [unclassified Conexibacter]MDO8189323.1 DUF3891 family protein [Conexibacter sp. CPCC 205706]MDO8201612.1 DUF3891 family protein [Conexibacter sp. CPCC 205762]MDR9372330.1 DUF3891 family protein [Conexibacter sp. JD483]
MLVRDAGDAWQIVMQTDHGDVAGQLVAAWGGEGFRAPARLASAALAATRHDDGWAVWERRPRLDPDTGAPRNFLGVPVAPHLAFYRAGVEVVCEEDRYAGLLVSMHMSGLYRQRYGVVPAGPMRLSDEERALADTFCDQEEQRQEALAALLEVSEEERWHDYALLQVADLVSLFCALGDLEGGTASGAAEAVPTADGDSVRVALEPLGPWRLGATPYPFAQQPLTLTMVRRLLPKRTWPDDAAFRADLDACPPETVRIYLQG